ncbi:ATP-dependent DNA helicase [Pyrobaculum aerophilum]|uniref:DEAD/DEAH box helicase n=1 Tax=Pyrobaculum aerophilum TaxID=13773 RepID=A0A371R6Z8_9CREN|nr:ATP-dependent DNA helicase [Pyrobaculum aerophilum]RFA96686.1 DEAD/DEAH box helicase [Pyrobaculum aerophilum]RFB00314.1 DEAD/DEAH box helicase [Pyrobaculum aerophilum]
MELFPYAEYRPFQREIYQKVVEALKRGRAALINAPTGIGKTSAVLAAAVEFMLETRIPVHYAVRTRAELEAPVRELARIISLGVDIDYVVIKSRQDMCCYSELKKLGYLEFLAECSLLKRLGKCAYYPPRDVEAPLKNVGTYVKFLCAAKSCPYEYARKKLENAEVTISTYYYVFGRDGGGVKNKVVIIDEAHSVFDAVIHLNSIKISERELRQAYREARKYGFVEEAAGVYRLYTFVKKVSGHVDLGDVISLLADLDVDNAVREITKIKSMNRLNPFTPLVLISELKEALKGGLRYYAQIEEAEGLKALALYPVDPAAVVKEALRGAYSVVYISGTLPVRLFADNLGLAEYDELDVPFNAYIPRANYLTIIDVGVTTKYSERTEEMYYQIAHRLAVCINASPRGVLAVFPSYDVMRGVRKYLKVTIPHWYEDRDEVEWEGLPEKFFLGGVARGRYTEGVEYTKNGVNLLSTVVIVGVPYPEPSPYLDRRVAMLKPRLGERAWSAVYLYQAMVSVRQAVGRLFRKPEDRGVIVLLDRRYAEPELWNSLSDLVEGALVVNHVEEAVEDVERFFNAWSKDAK